MTTNPAEDMRKLYRLIDEGTLMKRADGGPVLWAIPAHEAEKLGFVVEETKGEVAER